MAAFISGLDRNVECRTLNVECSIVHSFDIRSSAFDIRRLHHKFQALLNYAFPNDIRERRPIGYFTGGIYITIMSNVELRTSNFELRILSTFGVLPVLRHYFLKLAGT